MNKLIVVSGGTEGIGFAIVKKFMKNGFDVAISARNLSKLENTKSILEANFEGQKVHIFQADLSKKRKLPCICK